jgi:orotidine-5'-phosphate decarboxylase
MTQSVVKAMPEAKDKVFVALDVPTAGEARELVRKLSVCTRMFKVGSQLFTAAGPDFVRELVAGGAKVFLDLKYHDIPNTVGAAAAVAARLGVFMFNVHAAGGREMMRRAVDEATEAAKSAGRERPLVIGVTMLTSVDATILEEIGIKREMNEQVASLAQLAANSGLDGVVASPLEASLIRKAVNRPDFVIVTPGIRPAETSTDDQKRVTTPAAAIQAGADYLVVGRAITAAKDPLMAAQKVLAELDSALALIRAK